jgi:membrane-bound lytic murein transglycosylase D
MASSYLMKFFKEHNLPVVNPKWNFIEIDSITIKKPISINQLANLLNIPQKELSYLNPNFYIGQIPGNDNRVIIPAKKALAFIDIETQINGTEKQQKITAQNNPRVKHDPFGTVEINSIPQAEIKLPTTDVILCEAINSYNPGVDEYLKLRNLKAIGAIPANSILLGKAVTLNAKKFIKIFKVVNTNETINLLAEYLGKINEGETLFVKQ